MTGFVQPIRLLSNFIAGAMLLLFQPFKVGDLIEVAGIFGTVEDIQLLKTIIITPDNRSITVSNVQLTFGKMTNHSTKGILRLELPFGLADDDNLPKIKQRLIEILTCDRRILNHPSPTVAILEGSDSKVNLVLRPYVKVEDYWDVRFDLMEQVKLLFEQAEIAIPDSRQREKRWFEPEFGKERGAPPNNFPIWYESQVTVTSKATCV